MPPILDRQKAELCRAHSDDVLIFQWSGGRDVLPVDARMTAEQGEPWREQFGFPERPDPERRYPGRRVSAVEPFADGWLVGTDSGEWGGALYYVREDQPPQRVELGNVRALIPDEGGVRAFFGLAHLSSDEGEHRLITPTEDGFRVGEPEPLPGSPLDIARHNGMLYMAGLPERRGGPPAWGRVFRPGQGLENASVSLVCRENPRRDAEWKSGIFE